MEKLLPLGKIIFRGKEQLFGIYNEDRLRHIYIVGKTGTGKTTLLENVIIHDILNGKGLAYLDPHGDSVQKILDYIPQERIEDVIYFDAGDIEHPFGFNPLEKVPYQLRHLVALSLMSVFKKIWVDAWSARMEYILTNTLLALLEWPNSTLLDVNRMLSDDNFRKKVVESLKDEVVKAFWLQEFNKYHLQFRTEAIAPIQNKIGQFITNPLIRNIIGQKESTFNFREIMDSGKVFLANLSLGSIGEETASLLGGLIISKIQLSAMQRIDIPEEQRKDFYLYVDEFQNFSTESFVNILSEARKYHLGLILAHQYLDQVPESIIQAVFGNVGTLIIFRVGSQDAERLVKELNEEVKIEELVNLPSHHVFIKLLVKGKPTNPFLAKTLPPREKPDVSYKDILLNFNHIKYARKRALVEHDIAKIYKEVEKEIEGNLAYCRSCGQAFYSKEGESVCEDCTFKAQHKISLKKADVLGLAQMEKKKEDKKNTNLDEIIKKLKQNEF